MSAAGPPRATRVSTTGPAASVRSPENPAPPPIASTPPAITVSSATPTDEMVPWRTQSVKRVSVVVDVLDLDPARRVHGPQPSREPARLAASRHLTHETRDEAEKASRRLVSATPAITMRPPTTMLATIGSPSIKAAIATPNTGTRLVNTAARVGPSRCTPWLYQRNASTVPNAPR